MNTGTELFYSVTDRMSYRDGHVTRPDSLDAQARLWLRTWADRGGGQEGAAAPGSCYISTIFCYLLNFILLKFY